MTDSIGGASHVLSLTTHANLVGRIVQTAAWKAAGKLTIAIESVRLMVAHATPEFAVHVQRTTVINTIDISIQSFSHSVNGNSSAQASVPPSTREIVVSAQRSNIGEATSKGAYALNGVPLTQLAVSFAGQ